MRPLFRALRFGVVAGSWTFAMICPPTLPPGPDISTAPTVDLSARLKVGLWEATDKRIAAGAIGGYEPKVTECCKAF